MSEETPNPQRGAFDSRPRPVPHRTSSGHTQTLRPGASPPPHRHSPSPSPSHHRQSFTDQLRGMPPSPRQDRRHLSLSQVQMQELINNPPTAGHDGADDRFRGRDWRSVAVGELVQEGDLRWVELDDGIEETTDLLTESHAQVLLVRQNKTDHHAIATFDYRDLTQYLLFATGQLFPDEEHLSVFQNLARKAQAGEKIPLRDAKSLGNKEPFVTLSHSAGLTTAVEAFGGGVHRIVVVKEGTNHVMGVLSQTRLVKFLWENGRSFPVIDQLYSIEVKELGLGNQQPISINGDRPLKEALSLMNNEGITSLAVVDNHWNVVGNISNVDVKLLTRSSSAPLLENTCIHFISVILSNRGMNDGKDSYPVFHISPHSTLAHTVAKLVATKAHRVWVVDNPTPGSTPSSSAPTTPLRPDIPILHHHPPPQHQHQHHHSSASSSLHSSISSTHSNPLASTHAPPPVLAHPPTHPPHLSTTHLPQSTPPFQPLSATPSVSAAALPGQHMSGRLSGVVSLTDVLNLFARASGLQPSDPEEARRARRGSSASSRSGVSGRALTEERGDRERVGGGGGSARSSVVDVTNAPLVVQQKR